MKKRIILIVAGIVIIMIGMFAFQNLMNKGEDKENTPEPGEISGFYWVESGMAAQSCFHFDVFVRNGKHVMDYSFFNEKGDRVSNEEKKISDSEWEELTKMLEDYLEPAPPRPPKDENPDMIVLDGSTFSFSIYYYEADTVSCEFKGISERMNMLNYLEKIVK